MTLDLTDEGGAGLTAAVGVGVAGEDGSGGVGFERAAALGLNGAGEVDGEERLGEASPKGVVASGVGGGGARCNGGGSRRSSDSSEVCASLRRWRAGASGARRERGARALRLVAGVGGGSGSSGERQRSLGLGGPCMGLAAGAMVGGWRRRQVVAVGLPGAENEEG